MGAAPVKAGRCSGLALFKHGEPSDPELQRRYRLYWAEQFSLPRSCLQLSPAHSEVVMKRFGTAAGPDSGHGLPCWFLRRLARPLWPPPSVGATPAVRVWRSLRSRPTSRRSRGPAVVPLTRLSLMLARPTLARNPRPQPARE